jgi:hypothetical protein
MDKICARLQAAAITFMCLVFIFNGMGCANMIPPTGGPRDSIPPILIAETPIDSATNVTPKRITFVFNEYVEIQNPQENVLVSPTQNNLPIIDYKLRTVTVRLRDTLEPNTTYTINFGNAIKDINEGNVFKDFSYVFSTGSKIDVFTFSGKVILAETGKIDTTLVAILHRNLDDSAVAKERPRYIAKLDGQGNFTFRNLPAGTFALYATPNDYARRYDDPSELFAFADKPIVIADSTPPVTLNAYVDSPKPAPKAVAVTTTGREKRVRYTTNLDGSTLSILTPLQLTFNRKITSFDSSLVRLTTAELAPVPNYSMGRDTSGTVFTIEHTWPAGTSFNLILAAGAFVDSAGNNLGRADTIKFATKRAEEYGLVRLRFNNLDTAKHPVLQLVQNERIVRSVALTRREWLEKLIEPGEYELRVLFDTNRNGVWDPGKFFDTRRQPELVRSIAEKLTVRGNWDNERDITL